MVLANNNEMVLLPINEPTHGTRRKSQIQTYLEANMWVKIGGIGVLISMWYLHSMYLWCGLRLW